MKVDLITRREDLGALTERWDELARLDKRDGFFRTATWYSAWMEHIRPDAQPFVLVVRNAAGTIVGLAPLCRMMYRDLGFRLTTVAFAGREVVSADFLDFLAEDEMRMQVAAAVLDALWAHRSEWALVTLGELIEGGPSDCALTQRAKDQGLAFRRQEARLCPYIALPETFDEYLATLGSSTRYHIRRRMRDIVKQGGRIDIYEKPEDITARLELFSRLHEARWRKDNQPGTMGRPGFLPFLKTVCGKPPAGASCRMYILTHEEVPVAGLLTFYFEKSALYYQAGWEPDAPLAQYSPGVVLMARSIADAIEHRLRFYEFLRGDEAYKFRWTSTHRKTITLLGGRSFAAREYLRGARLKDMLKSRFPEVWNRLRNSSAPETRAGRQQRLELQP
jgi:CelD/BcsL family acetyltransferase involved in cellulose biosynthesis